MLEFRVECETKPGQHVGVCGSGPCGKWSVADCVILDSTTYPIWCGTVDAEKHGAIDFKYILVDTKGPEPKLIRWEFDGDHNRRADVKAACATKLILHHTFGDKSRSSVEVLQLSGNSHSFGGGARSATFITEPSSSPSPSSDARKEGAQGLPNAASGGQSVASGSTSGVLDAVQVGAHIRFSRLCTAEDAFAEKYELREDAVLGTGMSGGVVVAMDRKTHSKVAVKTLKLDGLGGDTSLDQVVAEIENQLNMDHPNICRLLEVFEEPGCLRMVMERMRGPDLFVHLNRKGKYTERDAGVCVRQMCSAVAYCHRQGVCHRDLKLDNFCLEDNTDEARVKLIDFGLSSVFSSNEPMTNACGTLYYVAPEVLSGSYDKKCDMWSLGVITYILLDGRAPFMGRDDRATYLLIKRGIFYFGKDRWAGISKEAQDFVSKLLQVDVSLRLDAEAAYNHPWFTADLDDAQAMEPLALDADVLQGMRAFTRSNALKRAVLRAVAPIATPDQVAQWADQFEALDTQGTGEVAVEDLAKSLVARAEMSEAEAEALAAAMAGMEGETVSYSAFLAACLSAHVTLGDAEMRLLFDRLDKNAAGRVSVEQVSEALGDVVDLEALEGDFSANGLTYEDFRWLMSMPRLGPTKLGLKNLVGTFGSLEGSWKSSTKKAKNGTAEEASEAARKENLAWRIMHQKIAKGEVPDSPVHSPRHHDECALSMDSFLLSRGLYDRDAVQKMAREEMREAIITDFVSRGVETREALETMTDGQLVVAAKPTTGSPRANTDEPRMERMNTFDLATKALEGDDDETQAQWSMATADAKDGSTEAARRENMHWRKMNMARKAQEDSLTRLREVSKETLASAASGSAQGGYSKSKKLETSSAPAVLATPKIPEIRRN